MILELNEIIQMIEEQFIIYPKQKQTDKKLQKNMQSTLIANKNI